MALYDDSSLSPLQLGLVVVAEDTGKRPFLAGWLQERILDGRLLGGGHRGGEGDAGGKRGGGPTDHLGSHDFSPSGGQCADFARIASLIDTGSGFGFSM